MPEKPSLIPFESIEKRIFLLRGQKVMMDAHLAELYGVTTKRFKEQVRRNLGRFPADFMFELTAQEAAILRPHFATSSWGGSRYRPLAFTEHGAIMAASVLNSPRAIEASVWVVRAFVRYREALATSRHLFNKLAELEAKVGTHDKEPALILEALKQLTSPTQKNKRRIGFGVKEPKAAYRPRASAKKKPESQRAPRTAKRGKP